MLVAPQLIPGAEMLRCVEAPSDASFCFATSRSSNIEVELSFCFPSFC